MKITSEGRVTIPAKIRRKMGLLPNTNVEFYMEGTDVIIRKSRRRRVSGERMVEMMRGKATVKMTTDEIMALLRGQ
jgi:AbrB family looped-hinge helix DNA binding protein